LLIDSIKEGFYLGALSKDILPKVYCSPRLTFCVSLLEYC